jgi:hypothetical protein
VDIYTIFLIDLLKVNPAAIEALYQKSEFGKTVSGTKVGATDGEAASW